ncbi:MAG: FKBP-type peptidyl-prolyl cis-trans isomerase [Thermodesulfobacteriota bacterium]
MTTLKNGDTVKVHYTGKLEDGRVFDTSREREPLEFKVGEGQIISGFENGVMGMGIGETRDIEVPPDDAYGSRREELVMEIPPAEFPEHITPEVGMQLQIKQQDGTPFGVVITDVADEAVTLDANHPLAGQTLYFQVELLEISNPA